ncbi:prolyl 4-hydroxylase alpha subunit [Calothrix sp. NIES-4101]|nr:prolyl 4-hydroxylase alpha subunit [Calothrix sp. NIES-4101]
MYTESELEKLESKEVQVKLLLAGGHEYTVYLNSHTPLLHSLLTSIAARACKQEPNYHGLFQIPINQGKSILSFPSENLVGIITEPPMLIQQTEVTEVSQDIKAEILPSEYIQIDNFLTPEEHKKLIKYVLKRKSQFLTTNTSTNDANYRRSMALYSFPEFSELILKKIRERIPEILNKFGISPFTISQIESQLTSHNDGNYYKVHNDNGSPETASRELTYVYYFYQEPKPFTGGELLIYDSKIENNFYVQAKSYKTVEPRNNSIVFFLSRYMHEVLPVSCPSKNFADSRFTINGWVRR